MEEIGIAHVQAVVPKLALDFQRSPGAINARLARLGKIEAPPALRLRGFAAPMRTT